MVREEKQAELQQVELEKYRILLHAILDYYIEHHTGSMVFDQWDPSIDHYLQQKQQTEKDFQDRKLGSLKQMFGGQIERARNHSDSGFADHIKEKTGYNIDINEYLPNYTSATNKLIVNVSDVVVTARSIVVQVNRDKLNEEEMIALNQYLSNRPTEFNFSDCIRKVMVRTSGTEKHALTEVSIILKGGSGCIYCANGENLPIKAFWKDKSTVVIETKEGYPFIIRHNQVSSFEDVVKIEYLES